MDVRKRKVCVVTGSRAEYGLLYWLLKELSARPEFELQLVATGAHLANEYGRTEHLILRDGFEIAYRVESLVAGDTDVAVTKSLGLGLIGFADCFCQLKPDWLVVLGDRYEILAAATAALVARIPIAHIHGGETTEGAFDEAIRHALTKMAHLHFTAAEDYRRRVVQMGESPQHVYVTGAVGLEWLHQSRLLSRPEITAGTGLGFGGGNNLLVVFHPETLSADRGLGVLEELLQALAPRDETLFFSASNADPGGREVTERIRRFVALKPTCRTLFESLGHLNFLSLLGEVDLIVGNSSSGILEAPALGTATVNIGNRQLGRLRASSIRDCPSSANAISETISDLLANPPAAAYLPYGTGLGAARKIAAALAETDPRTILVKRFNDLAAKATTSDGST